MINEGVRQPSKPHLLDNPRPDSDIFVDQPGDLTQEIVTGPFKGLPGLTRLERGAPMDQTGC